MQAKFETIKPPNSLISYASTDKRTKSFRGKSRNYSYSEIEIFLAIVEQAGGYMKENFIIKMILHRMKDDIKWKAQSN